MAKKFTLEQIKVKSCVTSLDDAESRNIRGGFFIRGRRFGYRTRWTSIDTRVENSDHALLGGNDGLSKG